MQKEFEFQTNVEIEIDKAISNDEFELNFQPIYELGTDKVGSVEILLRLHNKSLGNISIGELITIAEQSGQIINVDRWVIKLILIIYWKIIMTRLLWSK